MKQIFKFTSSTLRIIGYGLLLGGLWSSSPPHIGLRFIGTGLVLILMSVDPVHFVEEEIEEVEDDIAKDNPEL